MPPRMIPGGGARELQTQNDLNYLRDSVWPGRIELELFQVDVENSGHRLTDQHPHRGNGGPWSDVPSARAPAATAPKALGELVIEAPPDGNRTTKATGAFAPGVK